MPNRLQWEPRFSVGHAAIDAQHSELLTQCNLLADCCACAAAEGAEQQFDVAFDAFKTRVREHFDTEAAALAGGDDTDLEDHRAECDEFEYLVGEIATAENFDRLERQRFLAVWCIGHISDCATQRQAMHVSGNAPA